MKDKQNLGRDGVIQKILKVEIFNYHDLKIFEWITKWINYEIKYKKNIK